MAMHHVSLNFSPFLQDVADHLLSKDSTPVVCGNHLALLLQDMSEVVALGILRNARSVQREDAHSHMSLGQAVN